jgi:hypothetical protein
VISGIDDRAMTELARLWRFDGERVASRHADRKPRIALFEPPNSMDAGWTKWVLERYGFEFTSLTHADITGNLRDAFDVIVVGDERAASCPAAASAAPGADGEMTTRASSRSMRSCAAAARWSR